MVEELGPGTTGRLSKGQRVVAADWGQVTYQEYVAVEEKNLVRCALACVALTRCAAVVRLPVAAGSQMVHAAVLLPQPCRGVLAG